MNATLDVVYNMVLKAKPGKERKLAVSGNALDLTAISSRIRD